MHPTHDIHACRVTPPADHPSAHAVRGVIDLPPATPRVTRERVAAAVATLIDDQQSVTVTAVRRVLGGGSDRDIHRYLRELGFTPPAHPPRPPVAVPPVIAERILIAIVARAAANRPLRHTTIQKRSRARDAYVSVVLREYLARWPVSEVDVSNDNEDFVVLLDLQLDEQDGGSVTRDAVTSVPLTAPPERSAQDILHKDILSDRSRASQVTLPSDCNSTDTPPRCARRSPIRGAPSAAARGAPRCAGPPARHSGLIAPKSGDP